MTMMATTRRKNTYSTFTKYCYQKGTVPKDLQKTIPRSTRHYWRKQPIINVNENVLTVFEKESLDYAELFLEKENAVGLSQSLGEIIKVYQQIVGESTSKKQLLINNKNLVLETIENLKDKLGVKKMCNYLSITTHQYHAWKNNIDCTASLLKLCRKRFATQLMERDVRIIKEYMDNKEFCFLSRATIYWKIIRDGEVVFSKSSFYKYCKILGYGKRPVNNKCKKNAQGLIAEKTAQILHTDITYIKTADNQTNYLSFVEDNFSKFILLGKVSQNPTSDFIKTNIETVIYKYGLQNKEFQLIVDDGSENKGLLDSFLEAEGNMISKIIARIDIPFANNVVEALHKKFKNEFLQGNSFANYFELAEALPCLIEKYNNQYHDSLHGYSPMEVWNGAIPDKNRFKGIFASANEKRKLANREFNCCALL